MRQIWKHNLNKKNQKEKSVRIIKNEIKGDTKNLLLQKDEKRRNVFAERASKKKIEHAWKV